MGEAEDKLLKTIENPSPTASLEAPKASQHFPTFSKAYNYALDSYKKMIVPCVFVGAAALIGTVVYGVASILQGIGMQGEERGKMLGTFEYALDKDGDGQVRPDEFAQIFESAKKYKDLKIEASGKGFHISLKNGNGETCDVFIPKEVMKGYLKALKENPYSLR